MLRWFYFHSIVLSIDYAFIKCLPKKTKIRFR